MNFMEEVEDARKYFENIFMLCKSHQIFLITLISYEILRLSNIGTYCRYSHNEILGKSKSFI